MITPLYESKLDRIRRKHAGTHQLHLVALEDPHDHAALLALVLREPLLGQSTVVPGHLRLQNIIKKIKISIKPNNQNQKQNRIKFNQKQNKILTLAPFYIDGFIVFK